MLLNIGLQLMVLAGLWFTYQWMFVEMSTIQAKQHLFISTALALIFFSFSLHQTVALGRKKHVLKKEEAEKYSLAYSYELFSELYRSSPVPYVVIDERGIIESINFSCARLFGTTQNGLDGRNVFPLLIGGDEYKIALIPEYFKEGKFIKDVEVQIQQPDATVKWAHLSLFSFHDVKGKQKGLLTLVDITKQKLIDKAKTEFVSLASHQLRTPISGMKWNIELLLSTGSDQLGETQRAYIEKINHSLVQMDALVNDFLSASKFELGTLSPVITPLELAPFFEGVYNEYVEIAKQKEIRIETTVDTVTMQSDQHLLHMIASNLLGNAVKYTPSGGIVRFSARLDDTNLTLTVADTGIGIPSNDQDEIFSKLFRASNAQTHATQGTGLGLYIANEAVKVLGGTITFESKESVGTTFTVVLPR